MIVTEALTKDFDATRAVENLSITVHAGEVFGLLGPNGAGKTTTIRMLAALIGPTSGTAVVAGCRVGKDDQQIRRSVGILTETPGMYEGLSAARNLVFYARMYEVADVEGQVEKYLRMLGLWERRYELVGTFSKGMRQKLAIARALLHEPKVLFLDEPTSGLDPQMARTVREFIQELRGEGRTIVLTTHNLDVADRLCDRIGVIRSRLLILDSPAALRQRLFGRTVVFHLGGPAEDHRAAVAGFDFIQSLDVVDNKLVLQLPDPEAQNPVVIRSLVEAGADIQFVGEVRRSLEDIYLQIMEMKA
ncbi:MAG TPA: ABC transporter ATP-binding protein [Anaerolineales bacterium]|nr:ABC transporter ATP-binding protein [Anaerolineales bacterium]